MKQQVREIGFISILLTLITYKNILVNKWKVILITAFVGGLIGVGYAWLTPKTYVAQLTFALEDKSAAGMYTSLASQFGLDIGKDNGGVFKGDNIMELYKSQTLIERTLLTSFPFDGTEHLLINRYLTIAGADLKGNTFDYNKPSHLFTRAEDSLMILVCNGIVKEGLEVDKLDKKLAFISCKFRSTDEVFAMVFLERLTFIIKDAYLLHKTKRLKANINMLQLRIDSVTTELNTAMSEAASSQDQNQNPSLARVKIPYLRKQMNIQLLTTLYGELVKNIEVSKMALIKEEPLLEIIDAPKLPLKFEKKSRLFTGILYAMVGAFLSSAFIILSVLYREIQKRITSEKLKLDNLNPLS